MTSKSTVVNKTTTGVVTQGVSSSANGVPPTSIKELIPKRGYLHCEDELTYVLCKPKLLPLKSFTMEKLEKIQAEAVEKAKEMMENSQLD